jgi:hypothetical protein
MSPSQQQASQEALRRIREAQSTAAQTLDLKGLGLTALPAELGQLTNLERLDVSDNRLTALPAEVGQLTNLRELNLWSNRLTALPAELGQLTNLRELNLWSNQLTAVAQATAAVFIDGRRAGSAVLVGPRYRRYLVTAAQVLQRLDPRTGAEVAVEQVELEFPGRSGEQPGRATASRLDLGRAAAGVDVAVLDLGEDPPGWLPAPVPVWSPPRPPGMVWVLGYPLGEGPLNGVWLQFMVAGPVTVGTVQLDWIGDVGTFPGHNGGPVIDAAGYGLVGILVEGSESGRFDRFLPVTRIAQAWPRLRLLEEEQAMHLFPVPELGPEEGPDFAFEVPDELPEEEPDFAFEVPARLTEEEETVLYEDMMRSAFAEMVKPGRLLFNPPERMQLGQTVRVEVRLTRTLELDAELLERLRGPGKPLVEDIATAPLMVVTLKGDAFRITGYSDEEQSVTQDRITTWEFDIRALKRGKQQLIMSVSLRIPVRGQPSARESIPVREATIDVQVDTPTLVAHFVGSNWQWFIATMIAIAAVVVAVLYH